MPKSKPSPFKIFVFLLDAVLQVLLVVEHLHLVYQYAFHIRSPTVAPPHVDLLLHMGIAGVYQFLISNVLHYSLGIPTPTLAYWRKMYVLSSLFLLFLAFFALNFILFITAQFFIYASCALAILECVLVLRQNDAQAMP